MKNKLPYDLHTLLVELTNESLLYKSTEGLRNELFSLIRNHPLDAKQILYEYRIRIFQWLREHYDIPCFTTRSGQLSKQPARIVVTHIVTMLLEYYADLEGVDVRYLHRAIRSDVYQYITDDYNYTKRNDPIEFLLAMGRHVVEGGSMVGFRQMYFHSQERETGMKAAHTAPYGTDSPAFKESSQYSAADLEALKNQQIPPLEFNCIKAVHSWQQEAAEAIKNLHTVALEVTTWVDQQQTNLERNTIMSAVDTSKPVQTITYVYGTPAKDLTEQQLFDTISKLENEIKTLDTLETKPKKIVAKIEQLRADIKAIVDLVDGE